MIQKLWFWGRGPIAKLRFAKKNKVAPVVLVVFRIFNPQTLHPSNCPQAVEPSELGFKHVRSNSFKLWETCFVYVVYMLYMLYAFWQTFCWTPSFGQPLWTSSLDQRTSTRLELPCLLFCWTNQNFYVGKATFLVPSCTFNLAAWTYLSAIYENIRTGPARMPQRMQERNSVMEDQ
jgi:hypothetical protein